MDRSYPARTTTNLASAAMVHDWKPALLGAGGGCVLAMIVLWPTLLGMTITWQNNQAYQYAWLVLPMVVYLLGWHDPKLAVAAHPQPDYTGVFVALFAAIGWSAAYLMNIDAGRQFALVLAVQGIAMSTLGWRTYWRLAPIFGLLFLMVPSGDFLQPALRILTVKMIEAFAIVADLPHSVDGFVVSIGESKYIVLEECAGLPYFMLATFLGYCFGLFLYQSVSKIAALVLFGAFVGILSNGLRVNAIVLIDWIQGTQMPLTAHSNIQWGALIVALGLLFFALSKLADQAPDSAPDISRPGKTMRLSQLAPVVAGLSVLLIVGTVISLAPSVPRQPRATQVGSLPQNIADWHLASPEADWIVDQKHQTESLALTYRRRGQDLKILFVETLGPDAKLQESDLAPGERNLWHQNKIQKQSSCDASTCLTLLHTTWQNQRTEEIRHVYSTYSIGNFTTSSKLALRAAHGWERLTRGGHNPRIIGFTLDLAATDTAFDELAVAFRLIQSVLNTGNR